MSFAIIYSAVASFSCADLVQMVLCDFEKFWLCAKTNFNEFLKKLVKFVNVTNFKMVSHEFSISAGYYHGLAKLQCGAL